MKRASKTIAKVFHKKRKDAFDPFSSTVPLLVTCTTTFLETHGSNSLLVASIALSISHLLHAPLRRAIISLDCRGAVSAVGRVPRHR